MAKGDLLGFVGCPHCGNPKEVTTVKEMRITEDKNGAPFGYCPNPDCYGQLRIGGNPDRVRRFLANHPDIAEALQKTNSTATATTTGTGDTTAPGKRETPPGPDPVPEQPPRRRSLLEEALAAKG